MIRIIPQFITGHIAYGRNLESCILRIVAVIRENLDDLTPDPFTELESIDRRDVLALWH